MTTRSRKNDDIQPIRDQVLKRMLKMPPKPHKGPAPQKPVKQPKNKSRRTINDN
jgi:hypothetical protein